MKSDAILHKQICDYSFVEIYVNMYTLFVSKHILMQHISSVYSQTVIAYVSHLPPAIAPNVWIKMLAVNRIQLWTTKCQCRRLLKEC